MKTAPLWAQDLVVNAILYAQSQGYKADNVPNIVWRKRTGEQTSGWTSPSRDKISFSTGSSRLDTKLVVLHETAHIIVGCDKSNQRETWHTDRFWDVAWMLYRWAKLPMRYCQNREYCYKVGAKAAYKRSKR